MNRTIPLLILAATTSVTLADSENGKELHDPECTGYHGTELYSRSDRKVTDHFGLKRQLSMCIQMTGKGADWFPEDQDDVLDYMNTEFYRFTP